MRGNIALDEAAVGRCGDGAERDGLLHGVGDGRNAVTAGELTEECLRVTGGGRRILKLAARVQGEDARRGIAAGAGVVVEAALVGTPVVVGDGLAYVIAARRSGVPVMPRCTLYADSTRN